MNYTGTGEFSTNTQKTGLFAAFCCKFDIAHCWYDLYSQFSLL